jgi:hypothetical protein
LEIFSPGVGPVLGHQLHPPRHGINQVDQDGQKTKQAKHDQVRRYKQPPQPLQAQDFLAEPEERLQQIKKEGEKSHDESHCAGTTQ